MVFVPIPSGLNNGIQIVFCGPMENLVRLARVGNEQRGISRSPWPKGMGNRTAGNLFTTSNDVVDAVPPPRAKVKRIVAINRLAV